MTYIFIIHSMKSQMVTRRGCCRTTWFKMCFAIPDWTDSATHFCHFTHDYKNRGCENLKKLAPTLMIYSLQTVFLIPWVRVLTNIRTYALRSRQVRRRIRWPSAQSRRHSSAQRAVLLIRHPVRKSGLFSGRDVIFCYLVRKKPRFSGRECQKSLAVRE